MAINSYVENDAYINYLVLLNLDKFHNLPFKIIVRSLIFLTI